jgi:S-DNA-T family DNA segregation ATPase FtsK/SpoIIIE
MDRYLVKVTHILNSIKDKKVFEYVKQRRIGNVVEFGFRLPSGLSHKDVHKQVEALSASVGKPVEVLNFLGLVVIRVIEKELEPRMMLDPKDVEELAPFELLLGYDLTGQKIIFKWNHPHILIGAETGFGKTDLIRLLNYCLLHSDCDIIIIDPKMMSFMPFRDIPNMLIYRSLEKAYEILKKVKELVTIRSEEVWAYGNRKFAQNYKRTYIFLDEAAEFSPKMFTAKSPERIMAQEIEKCLSTIARLGREARVHLIFCTQYPTAEVVHNQIKINCGMRICFYVPSSVNSEVILDKGGAEELPAIPGRAIIKNNGYHTIQVPYVGDDDAWEKLLKPFKKRVTPSESTHGEYPSRLDARSDRDDPTIGDPQRFDESTQESIIDLKGTGARWNGRMGSVQNAKDLETLFTREEEQGDPGDTLE